MEKKRILSLFTCLALVLTLLPTAALAAEETDQTVETVTETYVPDVDLPDNDELFAGYVNQMFYGEQPGIMLMANYGEDSLTGLDKTIYTRLEEEIESVANATTETATKFVFTVSDLGISPTQTAESLEVVNLVTDGAISEEASQAIDNLFDYDFNHILDLLLVNHPYELYWYDKTVGHGAKAERSGTISGTSESLDISSITITISFSVAQSYQGSGGEYTVSGSQSTTIQSAVEKAQSIVSQYQNQDTYNRLKGYLTEICSLVEYNHTAADNEDTPYGDPWQLIYVFDGDTSTNVVCEGYAKAFQYLCDLSNFDDATCYTVTGDMTGGTGAGRHMWNIVTLDGENYLVDVTNSDADSVGANGELFLAGTSGSVENGYSFSAGGKTIGYGYDEDQVTLYGRDILTLATTSYDPETSGGEEGEGGEDPEPDASAAPAFTSTTAQLESADDTDVTFTLAAEVADTTYKVYTAETGETTVEGVHASAEGTTLTLTFTTAPTSETTYYISATEVGKAESARTRVTVTPYTRSSNATLSGLMISSGTLSPAFNSDATTYTASVAYDVTSITVTPTVTDSKATVTVNNNTVTSGSASSAISLTEGGETTITITVTAENGTTQQIYTITVTRAEAQRVPTTVEITGGNSVDVPMVNAIGGTATATLRLNATVEDQFGESMTGQSVTWSVSGPEGVTLDDTVTIDSTGLLTVTNEAEDLNVTVTATCGGKSGTLSVSINREESVSTFIEIEEPSPSTITIPGSAGETASATIIAAVYDQYGTEARGSGTISWSLQPSVTGVSVAGDTSNSCKVIVTHEAANNTEITLVASAGDGVTDSIQLTLTTKADAQVSFDNPLATVSLDDGTVTLNISVGNPGETPAGYTWQVSQGDALAMPSAPSYIVDRSAEFEIVKVGTATITAVYESETTYGTASVEIEVTGRSLSGANVTVEGITDYTGGAQTPSVTVTLNGSTLNPSTDYDVAINPTTVQNAGEYTVTVTGKGNYSGTAQTTFTIGKATPNLGQVSYASAAPIYTSTAPSAVNLSRTDNTVDGTLALAADTVFTAGTSPYTWVFTPSDAANYETVTGQIQLPIKENALTGISASGLNKANYQFGDTFDLSTVTVTARYANGDTRTLTADEITVIYPSGGSSFAMGDTSVTLSYQGQTCVVDGLTVDKASYTDQRINVDVVYTDTALKTVDFSSRLPENYGSMTLTMSTAASSTTDLLAEGYTTSGTTPLVTFALRDSLTAEDTQKANTLYYTVNTTNYNDFTLSITITVLAESLIGQLNVSVPTFAIVQAGYVQPAAQAITITNNTAAAVTITGVEVNNNYFILGGGSTASQQIAANGTDTSWTIRPAAGLSAGSYSAIVTVYYTGGSIEMPVGFTVNAPTVTPTPDPSPSRPSGGSSGGSSGNSGSSTNVSTDSTSQGGTITTETTAQPGANVSGGSASSNISASMGNTIVEQAAENNSDTVVIAPDISGGVDRTEVTIPSNVADRISNETNANLVVSTPVADVTITNAGLNQLANRGGQISVTTETTGSTVTVEVSTGGSSVSSVVGGVAVSVPVENTTPGTVAVLVHEDGTREVIRKSLADDGTLIVPLDGSATVEIVDNSKTFDDVPATNWAADAVAFASGHELFNGTSETTFGPDQSMTRGMLAQVLYNLESNPDTAGESYFADVSDTDYFAGAVTWASDAGIVTGYADGGFGPNDTITREQLAVMLYRYAQTLGYDVSATADLSRYEDADQISDYAVRALSWANAEDLVSGITDSELSPAGSATRAQVATILMRFCQRYAA